MDFIFLSRLDRNSKLRAYHFAQTTIETVVTAIGANCMVPFAIQLCGFMYNLLRAELNAELAPFTPVLEHIYLVVTCFYVVLI